MIGPRGRNGVGITAYLLALAMLPLLGSAWFGASALGAAAELRRSTDRIDELTTELVLLTELRTGLLDESNWSAATYGIVDLGLPSGIVRLQTGVDLPGQLDTSRTTVDGLVAELGADDVAAELAEIRTYELTEIRDMVEAFKRLELMLAARADVVLDELQTEAASVPGGDRVTQSVRLLQEAAGARQAMANQNTSYFAAQFSPFELAEEDVLILVEQRAIYEIALLELERLAPAESSTRAGLDALATSEAARTFTALIDEFLTRSLAIGLNETNPNLQAVLGDLSGVAQAFSLAAESTNQHFELLQLARADVAEAAAELEAEAATANQRTLATIVVVVGLSLGFVAVLSRTIGRPLRDLADNAVRIRDGDLPEAVTLSGPVEVREATQAINEAALTLELAERQATALARGQLQHSALAEQAPGRLGSSLHDAVRTLATSMADREEFRRRLAHEASHDGLTQLPNRSASMAELRRALARSERGDTSVAALFIDLDGFKGINDHHGHLVGDTVLQAVAERLLKGVRDGDHVGRLGGDEFLVVVEPVASEGEALELAERLHEMLSLPLATGDHLVDLGASIGVSVAVDPTIAAEDLLREADLALYHVKANGRAAVQLCTDELRLRQLEEAELEEAVRHAMAEDEFQLHFQPIVHSTGHEVVALEALVRWERPGEGLVPPGRFIPFAERTDLIVEIDHWVASAVVRQLAAWADDPVLGNIPVAVNVSGRTLGTESIVGTIIGALDRRDVDPHRLIVEVTESALLADLETTANRLQQLRLHGVRTAIDDFGTGYTSLGHLRTLPVDVIKIDRSFTNDLSARSLVKLIIDTGHLLGATITAEGVETPEQASDLRELGSDELQGFYFARPVPAAQVGDVLREVAAPTA